MAELASASAYCGHASLRGRTVVDARCAQHLILSLDVWIEELCKVEVVGRVLPLDEVLDLLLVPHIAFAADDRYGLDNGMDSGEQLAEVGDGAAGDLRGQ